MAEANLPVIRRFLKARSIAVVGVSRNPKHFSRMLFRDLRKRGLPVTPVNPHAGEIEGLTSIPTIPEGTEAVLVMTPATATARVCEDAIAAGASRVWMYRAIGHGAVDPVAAERCRQAGMEVVEGQCPYMFLEDAAWFHRLHGGLMRITGKYPSAEEISTH